MNIQVICIGDELLSGDTLNTNLLFIGEELARVGLNLDGEACVPDDLDKIQNAIRQADGADAVIFVGGLGPTTDDLTRTAVARYLGLKLTVNPAIRQHLVEYLGAQAATRTPDFLDRQAQYIETAEIIPNHNGTVPGLLLNRNSATWVLLPGPPREIKPMFMEEILPRILQKSATPWESLTVRVCGLPESQVETIAQEAIKDIQGLHFAICIKRDCIMVRLGKPVNNDTTALPTAARNLKMAFGYRLMPEECVSSAHYLGLLLKQRKLMLATAESCTGGGISAAMTDVAGSSEWIVGAVVTYANEWKMNVLGVKAETLRDYGAVSEQTVHQMLDGLQKRFDVKAGIAVSGIAGPGGGTPDKPVGTVVIGAYAPGWRVVKTCHFTGQRDAVRQRTVSNAINLLIEGLCR